ncbi:hypothetical protein DFH09DRAFT_1324061 [Mycena vulgaris]|nr:hypothetical protein DFH09DRAFT_1324061 [Mycena vulgaris]
MVRVFFFILSLDADTYLILNSFKCAKNGNGQLHCWGVYVCFVIYSSSDARWSRTAACTRTSRTATRCSRPGTSKAYRTRTCTSSVTGQYGDSQRWWGRDDAMDCDKRWERIKIVVDAIVGGEGASLSEGKGVVGEIKASYGKKEKELTDEFSKPIIVNGTAERSKARVMIHSSLFPGSADEDTLFFFNNQDTHRYEDHRNCTWESTFDIHPIADFGQSGAKS